jgi:hypothetical protein
MQGDQVGRHYAATAVLDMIVLKPQITLNHAIILEHPIRAIRRKWQLAGLYNL